MTKKFNLEFLEQTFGEFDKEGKYPKTSLYEGQLIYVEKDTKNELNVEIQKINNDPLLNPFYIWGFTSENGYVYVKRSIGENKVFIFSETMTRTEYVKGKLDILNNLDKENMDNLFDQKAVFGYFYKKLWDLRLKLSSEIRDSNGLNDSTSLMEAQHILDRIIFTYFICEKKLISIENYGPISGKDLFSTIIIEMENPWEYLKKLFFEQFAIENSEKMNCGGDTYLIIPYLNGGLFREKKIANRIMENDIKINYNKDDWKEIFDLLNKYTWIIEDKAPDFQEDEENYEGNLTPEIIGHIYEKFVISIEILKEIEIDKLETTVSCELRKGNKTIGAYYTPEHITNYISKNTIEPYLFNNLNIQHCTDFYTFLNSEDKEILQKAYDLLDNIKICDPAAGSGAFLIKAGEVLLEYKRNILAKLNNNQIDRYALKKDIIIKNLYGVDIQEEAIEICKLRLWLWLMGSSSENKGEPLPNIEYNFKVGNTVIGWLDEDLAQISLNNPLSETVKGIFKGLIAFANDEDKKLLITAENYLMGYNLDDYIESYYLLYKIYRNAHGKKAEDLRDIIEIIKSSIYNSINFAFRDYINEKINPRYNNNNPPISEKEFNQFAPFHWRVDFGHIIKNGGFDVIIGNPPYGNLLNDNEKKAVNKLYKSTKGEIAALFVERSIKMLKDQGEFGYIITYAITFRKDFSKTRNIINKNFDKCFISSFDRDKCRFFEGMSQSVSILLCHNKIENSNCSFYTSKMFREMPSINNIKYQRANNYLLGKNIGVSFNESHRLPKIGDEHSINILNKLLTYNKTIENGLIKDSHETLWIRTSGNYWYNSWDKKPYNSTEIKDINIIDGFSGNIISIMNSSIFYLWLRIYGDGRHMNRDIMNIFPLFDDYEKYSVLMDNNSKRLMKYLFLNFDEEKNRFMTSKVKPIIDISDILLGILYGLSKDEIDFILNYESIIRGGKKIEDTFYVLFEYVIFLTRKNSDKQDIEFIIRLIDLLAEEAYSNNKKSLLLIDPHLKDLVDIERDEEKTEIINQFIKDTNKLLNI